MPLPPLYYSQQEILFYLSGIAWAIQCNPYLPNHLYHIYLHPHPPLPLPRCCSSKESTCNAGDRVRSLGQEDPLEKEMTTHSRILAREMPWTEEPGRLQSMESQRVWHNLVYTCIHPLWPDSCPLSKKSLFFPGSILPAGNPPSRLSPWKSPHPSSYCCGMTGQ